MLATVALDLTQAILIGIAISALIYIRQSAGSAGVTSEAVDPARLRQIGQRTLTTDSSTHIYYLTGPLFFGSVHPVLEAFETAERAQEDLAGEVFGVTRTVHREVAAHSSGERVVELPERQRITPACSHEDLVEVEARSQPHAGVLTHHHGIGRKIRPPEGGTGC